MTNLVERVSTRRLPVTGSPARRAVLARRVRWLVAATITYNVIEAVVAISAGTVASSTALVSFGLDSVIEVSSAAAVAWQFAATDHHTRQRRERVALRAIAVSFFALATYALVEAARTLFGGTEAPPPPRGPGGAAPPAFRRPRSPPLPRGSGAGGGEPGGHARPVVRATPCRPP